MDWNAVRGAGPKGLSAGPISQAQPAVLADEELRAAKRL
jgi:hypothetical protein